MRAENDLTRLLWVVGNENWTDPKGVHRGVACAALEFARLLYRATDLILRGNHSQPFQVCRQDLLIVHSPVHLRMIRQVYGAAECQPVYAKLGVFARFRILAKAVQRSFLACAQEQKTFNVTAILRVTTKAIETVTLFEKLKIATTVYRPQRVVAFEFGYVGLAILLLKNTTSAFIQHGFLNRFQIPTAFDKYYLNLEWDKAWIESHLEHSVSADFLYGAKPRPALSAVGEKRLLWCLEYPWRQLPAETMLAQMRRFFEPLTRNGWHITLRAHPYDGDESKWYSELLSPGQIEMDSYKDLSIQKSLHNNRCIAMASFSSASMIEALFSGALPVLLNHSVKEFIVGNTDRLSLCLNSEDPAALNTFSCLEPGEIIRLAQQKRDDVFGQVASPREDLDAPHLS